MADIPDTDPQAPKADDIAASIVAEVVNPATLEKLRKYTQNLQLEAAKDGVEFFVGSIGWVAAKIATLVNGVVNAGDPAYNELAKSAVDTLLGEGVRHASLPTDAGRRLLDKLAAGGSETMTPGVDGAANYLTLMLNESVEAWARGMIVELFTSINTPMGGLESVEAFSKLEEIVEGALGGQRMIRRVLQPFINATAITPAQWHVNKLYRPELLSPAAAIDAYLAGRLPLDELLEELARQGHSLSRINTLIDNARKRLSFADLVEQFQRGAIADTDVISRAGELGYDEATARELLTLATAKRRDRYKDPIVDAAVAAYVARDIDDFKLRTLVEAAAPTYTDAQLIIDAAKIRREVRVRQLSSSDERRLVLKKLRSVADFERALDREGYDPEAITALGLELRLELDDQKSAAQHAADAAAEKKAAQQKAAEEKAKRDAEIAARNALPTLQQYQRAYVHGLIDRSTFAAAIEREKVAITPADLELLLGDADLARADWLEQQERAKRAREKDTGPGLTLAQLEAAVLADRLTLADYDSTLAGRGYDDDERRVLVALLNGRLEDQAAARAARDQAAKLAEVKRVSLPDLERAARLGLRSVDDVAALLDAIGTPAVAKALTLDLLRDAMAKDDAARQARAQHDATPATPGLSIPQRRRAVIAGILSRDAYAAALIAAQWPIDDQLVELALVDQEAADAAAARARRDEIAAELAAKQAELERQRQAAAAAGIPAPDEPTLTLGQMQHAVTLGLLPPDALRDYLRVRGYVDADIETIVGLAVAAVPDVVAGKAREQQVAGELAERGLSLAQMQDAVRRGIRTLDQYAEELAARGYGEDDVALLRQLLEEQRALDVDTLRTKIAKALEAHDDAPALDELDAALVDGAIDVGQARDILVAFGVPRDTAIVYARILAIDEPEG